MTICAISPYSSASAAPGTGSSAGRCSARPSACESSRLVTGSGAVPLTGPDQRSSSSAASIIPTRSSTWIHDTYWRPPATGPPTPSRKGGSIFASAPPRRSSTTPVRTCTRRIPRLLARRGLRLPRDAHLREEVARPGGPPRRAAPRRAGRSSRSPRRSPAPPAGRLRSGASRSALPPDGACRARGSRGSPAWRARSSAARRSRRPGAPPRRALRARACGAGSLSGIPARCHRLAATLELGRSAARARSGSRESTVTSVAVAHQRRDQRGPDQARRAGERHPHGRALPYAVSRCWARGRPSRSACRPARSRPPGRRAPCRWRAPARRRPRPPRARRRG